ncbi:MAG: WD40 repeat domain-containing protein [Planctomycetes bacterium]|nr:WD40 repeat domain-containing protein [Planctomycetota bacterium]
MSPDKTPPKKDAAKPATANKVAAKADPKATHIVHQWKNGSPLIACRFDPQGRYVFTSAEDNTVQRWEIPSGKKIDLAAHDSWVRDIAFLPDGETMISVGSDEQMIFWPTAVDKPAPIRKIKAHQGWIRTVSVSPDGKLLATGGNDNLVKLWNAADGRPVRTLTGHESNVYSTLFHPDGKLLLSGDLAGQVKQWEIATGKLMRTFDAKDLHSYNGGQQVHYGGVRSMSISPDKKLLICSGLHKATNPLGAVNEPLVVQFDWATQKKLKSHVASGVKGIAWRALFHQDGFLIGASGGSGGGYLVFWKTDSDKEFHKLKLPNTARAMDLHPDGLQLATAHADRHVRISRMTKKA